MAATTKKSKIQSVQTASRTRKWNLSKEMQGPVTDYTCKFDKPFWAKFKVSKDGKTRVVGLPDGKQLTETLLEHSNSGYAYAASGFAGITNYKGVFSTGIDKKASNSFYFEIDVTYTYDTAKNFNKLNSVLRGFFKSVDAELKAHFG